jgi:hypothetical protein
MDSGEPLLYKSLSHFDGADFLRQRENTVAKKRTPKATEA